MGRSRKLKLTNWTSANNTLIQRFEGNKSKLAEYLKMSRTTVTRFFNEKPIGEGSFRKICLALRIPWQDVSSVDSASPSTNQTSESVLLNKILIDQVKQNCRQNIWKQHSRIRLLSGEETRVDQLYVDVWLLERPENRRFDTSEALITSFDIKENRLALGKRIQRNPGFDIANNESKLVILGKPGSGKTTFLKHLAVDWYEGKFQPDKIFVLIELRQIRDQTWSLIDAIGRELKLAREKTLKFLEESKLLVVMDGLDEVPTNELRCNVQSQVKQVSEQYSEENRFILTCRTQIINEIPSGFISVEVADFSAEQVKRFVQNWFTINGQSKYKATQKWHALQHAITNQPDLRELTATPVLLSLICVVLRDTGKIPTNRTELYEKGINWLLSRWNNDKNIEDWEVGSTAYRQLSIEAKERLLVEIAARKFENPENFVLFKQSELASQISKKLDLANVQEGIAVLKAIEAQHGLLIERADELWSFSHLTFQEYFTVQWLTQLSPQQLAAKIENQRWRVVVEQLIKSQQPANQLLRLVKQAIDQSIAQESDIQIFLDWLHQKSNLHSKSRKDIPSQVFFYYLLARFLYLSAGEHLSLSPSRALLLSLHLVLDRARTFGTAVDFSIALESIINLVRSLQLELKLDFDLSFDLVLDLNLFLTLSLGTSLVRYPESSSISSTVFELDVFLDIVLFLAQPLNLSSDMIAGLSRLKNELPEPSRPKNIKTWWGSNGSRWVNQLQQLMLEYRDIGHDWQFTENQQKQLHRYYEANRFLVHLMQIRGGVSEKYRVEIEEGLMLPRAKL